MKITIPATPTPPTMVRVNDCMSILAHMAQALDDLTEAEIRKALGGLSHKRWVGARQVLLSSRKIGIVSVRGAVVKYTLLERPPEEWRSVDE